MDAASRLAQRIAALAAAGESLWAHYQAVGPGQVDLTYYEALQAAARQLDDALPAGDTSSWLEQITAEPRVWLQDLRDGAARLQDLARRCACTPRRPIPGSGGSGISATTAACRTRARARTTARSMPGRTRRCSVVRGFGSW